MKNNNLKPVISLVITSILVISCAEENSYMGNFAIDKPNTQQQETRLGNRTEHTITFEGEYWDALSAHNWGNGATSTTTLLPPQWSPNYDPTKKYEWKCPTTTLSNVERPDLGWGKGYPWFVSSYNSKHDTIYGDYLHDLYVYNSENTNATTGGGNGNSNNFITNYGYSEDAHPEYGDGRPILSFSDGVPRKIKSIYVNSTCYFLNVATHGNDLSPELGVGEDVLLHAYGYDAEGNETGHITMTFATHNMLIKNWIKWDLSALGKIVKLRLNMTGGTDNGYGFSLPAYYAIDDITVEL